MNESVSVDEAIAKGHRMVNHPIAIIAFVIIVTYFFAYQQITDRFPPWGIAVGFLPTIVLVVLLAWLYWSIMITKWRLWAFENVRNVHELKKRAIQEKLIWPEDSVFNKTEIRSAADVQKWDSLQY
ncbi:MAG: hypothetical protein ACKVTZ_17610, partial [Bacteroidia bacterium]